MFAPRPPDNRPVVESNSISWVASVTSTHCATSRTCIRACPSFSRSGFSAASLFRDQQILGKRPLAVDPLRVATEPRVRGHRRDFISRVLVTALRPNGLVLPERNRNPRFPH